MGEIVVVSGDAPEEEAAEVAAEVEAEAIEEVVDAAVEIEQIRADKEIALAVIAAETAENQQQIYADERVAALEAELDACRNTISTLQSEVGRLTEELSTRPALVLEEPPPSPTPPESADVDPTQASPTPAGAVPPPEPERKRKAVRFI